MGPRTSATLPPARALIITTECEDHQWRLSDVAGRRSELFHDLLEASVEQAAAVKLPFSATVISAWLSQPQADMVSLEGLLELVKVR